jgi:mono/diheme cytochrome c family protein
MRTVRDPLMAVRKSLFVVMATASIGAVAFLFAVYSGIYNVAATDQHGVAVAWALHAIALRSIEARSSAISVPQLLNSDMIANGLRLFRRSCSQCHGAPGEAPDDFAKGLLPGAPRLEQVGRQWTSRNIYWVVAHGIKMTAMPAWEFRLTNQEIWNVVAFVKFLPKLSSGDYKAMVARAEIPGMAMAQVSDGASPVVQDGNSARGRVALAQYACASCHVIPGISEPGAFVGPTLKGIGSRVMLAGWLANTPINMREWILHPQQVKGMRCQTWAYPAKTRATWSLTLNRCSERIQRQVARLEGRRGHKSLASSFLPSPVYLSHGRTSRRSFA